MKHNKDFDLQFYQGGIGSAPEVNEKNDDFCVWQFNHHGKIKARQTWNSNFVFTKTHIGEPDIERELRQIHADFEAGKYDNNGGVK